MREREKVNKSERKREREKEKKREREKERKRERNSFFYIQLLLPMLCNFRPAVVAQW